MSMYIEQDAENTVVLRLWEAVTLDDPYYVFHFKNETTEEEIIFLAEDETLNAYRYNMFTITETSTGLDPYTGKVMLRPGGQWLGKVYETATQSLDPADWGALLKVDMVIVSEDTDEDVDLTFK